MKAVLRTSLLTWMALTSLCLADSSAQSQDWDSYRIAVQHPGVVVSASGHASMAKALTDTFYIYGGPGTPEGRFQTIAESPGGAPDPQGWIGVDLTEQTPHWRAGTTNAESTADGNPKGFTGGVGNMAALSYHEGADYVGYGNSWDDWFVFTYDVSAGNPGFNPAVDVTTIRYTCEYKHFTEELYDYTNFEWNQAGAYQTLIAIDGTSYNDSTGYYEIRNFDSDSWGGITYNPGDYIDGTKVQLRIRITSDGGWSDEDGLFTTDGLGAAAIDNITVYVNAAVVSTADFEPLAPKVDLPEGDFTGVDVGADIGTAGWTPTPSTFVGDFSKIYGQFQDIDICRDNVTPQFTFINDGTGANNSPLPLAPAISPTWTYGIPGGYVVDFNGGLTNGVAALTNEIWSPEFDWDLPGTEDDVANGGAVLGYTRWTHMPLINAIFAVWSVRSFDGSDWTGWESNNFVYYGASPAYGNFTVDVTDKLVQNPDKVQISLGVADLAGVFGWPGNDAAPSPNYDNVYLKKYVIGGPVFSTRTIDLASDCFPIDGTLSGSCRFDANIDRDRGVLVPGDSIVAEIKAIIPGTVLASPLTGGDIVVNQLVNPDFAVQRAAGLAAVGATMTGTDSQSGWDIWEYRVAGQQVTNNIGDVIADRYFWDLPDGLTNGLPHISTEDAILFPGDVVHYYLEASDDLGNTTTLPEDTAGFGDFTEGNLYDRVYVLRMLPTLQDGNQPGVLFWNDFGHRGGENEYLQAFRQVGLVEGVDYDTYTTKGPSSGVGNGLGSSGYHGANAEQIADYDVLIYVLGNLSSISISDGSGDGDNDLSADLATVEAWANADADRFHVYFGDDFAESMVNQGAACQSYLNNGLGVDLLSVDVGPAIDDQTAATLKPTGNGSGAYVSNFVAYGGCLVINDFDEIGAFGVGPVLTHEFTDPNGSGYPTTVAGSVEWLRLDGNSNIKHSIVFPYDLSYVVDDQSGFPTGVSARSALLEEVFASFGLFWGGFPPGVEDPDNPGARHVFSVAQNHPNPFNPRTRIEFTLPSRQRVTVKVYNVRGELIASLLDEPRDAGPGFVDWTGRDHQGSQVASGVYLYTVSTAGQTETRKMALIR